VNLMNFWVKFSKKIFFCFLVFSGAVIFSADSLCLAEENMPWDVGEKLTFAVRWGVITGGYANMQVREKLELGGRETYRIVTQARSAPFFDVFYRVRNNIQSYIDVEYLHSVRYERNIREGDYERDSVTIYDHDREVAYEDGERFDISRHCQDVLSSLYYLRTKNLEVGETYEFNVGTSRKDWPLYVEVLRRERIRVPAGTFDTLVVKPYLREEGIFKARGDLKVWLTDDERKHPVLMRSRIKVGSISAALIEKELP